MVRMWCSGYYDGCLWWSGYYDGWAAVVRVLRWLGCSDDGTTMVGQLWSGYYDSWTGAVRVLRYLYCGDEGTTMAGLGWSGYYNGWTAVARVHKSATINFTPLSGYAVKLGHTKTLVQTTPSFQLPTEGCWITYWVSVVIVTPPHVAEDSTSLSLSLLFSAAVLCVFWIHSLQGELFRACVCACVRARACMRGRV